MLACYSDAERRLSFNVGAVHIRARFNITRFAYLTRSPSIVIACPHANDSLTFVVVDPVLHSLADAYATPSP